SEQREGESAWRAGRQVVLWRRRAVAGYVRVDGVPVRNGLWHRIYWRASIDRLWVLCQRKDSSERPWSRLDSSPAAGGREASGRREQVVMALVQLPERRLKVLMLRKWTTSFRI
ncbi:hypothetical protein BaRGS_00036425, partial [Batillaria attramentaria]